MTACVMKKLQVQLKMIQTMWLEFNHVNKTDEF
jgi:hypothetical protein